jgi:hypothetical protein
MPQEEAPVDLSQFKTQETPELKPVPETKVPDPETPKKTPEVILPIKDEDRDRYFNCVLNNLPYYEVLEALGGKLKIGFRTRTVQEAEEVTKYINDLVQSKQVDFFPDYQNKHLMGTLAFAIVSINEKNIDQGDLKQRIERLVKLNNQIYMMLVELLRRFDSKMETLREECLKPNF